MHMVGAKLKPGVTGLMVGFSGCVLPPRKLIPHMVRDQLYSYLSPQCGSPNPPGSHLRPSSHKGLEAFFRTGSKAGIQPHHATKLQVILTMLDSAKRPEDMNASSWHLHSLTGNLVGHWSVRVNGNWRVTFRFEGEHAELVDYQDCQ